MAVKPSFISLNMYGPLTLIKSGIGDSSEKRLPNSFALSGGYETIPTVTIRFSFLIYVEIFNPDRLDLSWDKDIKENGVPLTLWGVIRKIE